MALELVVSRWAGGSLLGFSLVPCPWLSFAEADYWGLLVLAFPFSYILVI